jgi:hypothetical protein
MSLKNILVAGGAVIGILVGGKKLLGNTAAKFNVDLPLNKLLIKTSLLATTVDSVLVINNHSNSTATLTSVRATINVLANNIKTEIASSLPSAATYTIKPVSINPLQLPTIKINHLAIVGKLNTLKNALINSSDKIEVIIEGNLNGFPFKTAQLY